MPPPRSAVVARPRLIERLNEGKRRKLTLVCASAGSGKTTLVSEWLGQLPVPAAWLSLDEGDNDPARFLAYLFAALGTVSKEIGAGALGLLDSPQPPAAETVLTGLLNELAAIPDAFVLVLDDYHAIASEAIDRAVAFLLERMPPQMHVVMMTRADPRLAVARLRVRNQLTEIRAEDLRFTAQEADEFLNRVMGLKLSPEEIGWLEDRTEGWIAGLQLAALSLQGQPEAGRFVSSFTGGNRYVLDYLVEEVLRQQPDSVREFLRRTAILDRMCGPLCDAVFGGNEGERRVDRPSGQAMLEFLERSNLFVIPLDDERRWYRYHHLFADLLRQRKLHGDEAPPNGEAGTAEADLHLRASLWFEQEGLEIEAFRHAAAANDTARAARLLEGGGMPLLFRGAVAPVRQWLESLPEDVLDAHPSLWVQSASALLLAGQTSGVEPKLLAAELALSNVEHHAKTRDLIGHIASIRATMAVSRHEAETILSESRRALSFLHPDNLPVRTATTWTLGYAYQLKGDRAAAGQAYAEALSISETIGHVIVAMMAALGLGMIQEADNRLYSAAATYERVIRIAGNPPPPAACEAYLGLARIHYEWNDLDAAERYAAAAAGLARQLEQSDRIVAGEAFQARLKLARGEFGAAAALLAAAEDAALRHGFENQLSRIADIQALTLLRQGHSEAAARLAQAYGLDGRLVQAYLAQGDVFAARAALEKWRRDAETKGWADERLKALVLLAVAQRTQGDERLAERTLADALAMAEPGGYVRLFVEEGEDLLRLLDRIAARNFMPEYVGKLLSAFRAGMSVDDGVYDRASFKPSKLPASLPEPLSERESEILGLIAQGLSNQEICDRLFLALSTVKGYNRNLFGKLQVSRRTEAVARARELGLL